jgi:hypothetical protein
MARRVSSLLLMADGKAPVARASWSLYFFAACLAALLGLGAGEQIAHNHSAALAVVLGAPRSNSADLQSFQDVWKLKRAPAQERTRRQSAETGGRHATRPKRKVASLGRLAIAPVALTERDFPKWVAAIAALARSRGIPPEQVRREVRENWHAVPLLAPHPAPIGIYRIELRP